MNTQDYLDGNLIEYVRLSRFHTYLLTQIIVNVSLHVRKYITEKLILTRESNENR